jgi:hypothetical protein
VVVLGVVVVVVVCYVVTAFRGRTKWLRVLIFNCVYVVKKLVQMFGYTCIASYFFWMFQACIVCFMALQEKFGALC